MSTEAPVVPVIFLITAPPGPMTAPIFSGLILIVVTEGAEGATVDRGSEISAVDSRNPGWSLK